MRVVHVPAADGAVVGRRAGESHRAAQVVAALRAECAPVARHAGLDGHAVARAKVGDGSADGGDGAGAFVAEDVGCGNYALADGAYFKKQ